MHFATRPGRGAAILGLPRTPTRVASAGHAMDMGMGMGIGMGVGMEPPGVGAGVNQHPSLADRSAVDSLWAPSKPMVQPQTSSSRHAAAQLPVTQLPGRTTKDMRYSPRSPPSAGHPGPPPPFQVTPTRMTVQSEDDPGVDGHVAVLLHQLVTLGSQGHSDQQASALRYTPVPGTYEDMQAMVYRAVQRHTERLGTLNDQWQETMHHVVDIEGEIRRERQKYLELIAAWEDVARDRDEHRQTG